MHAKQYSIPSVHADSQVLQDAAPVLSMYVSAGQGSHDVCPEDSWYLPLGHAVQFVAAIDASSVNPAGHFVQVFEPDDDQFPLAHAVHLVDLYESRYVDIFK